MDVRVIAATKKNLVEELRKGTFREDLFYRLSVIPLFIPPLRERKQDLQALFNHFMEVKALKLNKPVPAINDELKDQIMRYQWPGNVRELENFVENLVNFNGVSSFNILEADHTPGFHNYQRHQNEKQKEPEFLAKTGEVSLEELEKRAIRECMRHHDGNVTRVSRQLGISRTTLYSKMRKYRIDVN